eukprot:7221393-Pyramimonas_sp.AAC.1
MGKTDQIETGRTLSQQDEISHWEWKKRQRRSLKHEGGGGPFSWIKRRQHATLHAVKAADGKISTSRAEVLDRVQQ